MEEEAETWPDHALSQANAERDWFLEKTSWGYLRRGNAYQRPVMLKPAQEPLDVGDEQAPHG